MKDIVRGVILYLLVVFIGGVIELVRYYFDPGSTPDARSAFIGGMILAATIIVTMLGIMIGGGLLFAIPVWWKEGFQAVIEKLNYVREVLIKTKVLGKLILFLSLALATLAVLWLVHPTNTVSFTIIVLMVFFFSVFV